MQERAKGGKEERRGEKERGKRESGTTGEDRRGGRGGRREKRNKKKNRGGVDSRSPRVASRRVRFSRCRERARGVRRGCANRCVGQFPAAGTEEPRRERGRLPSPLRGLSNGARARARAGQATDGSEQRRSDRWKRHLLIRLVARTRPGQTTGRPPSPHDPPRTRRALQWKSADVPANPERYRPFYPPVSRPSESEGERESAEAAEGVAIAPRGVWRGGRRRGARGGGGGGGTPLLKMATRLAARLSVRRTLAVSWTITLAINSRRLNRRNVRRDR